MGARYYVENPIVPLEQTIAYVNFGIQGANLLPTPDPVFGARVDREFRNVARSARRVLRLGVENAVMTEWLALGPL